MSESSIAESINLGAINEALNDKMDRDGLNADIKPAAGYGVDYVVEWKVPTESDPSWYRLYASGWIEQGGYYANQYTGTSSGTPSISLIKTMQDTNYYISRTPRWTESQTSDNLWYMGYQTKTINSFSVKVYGSSYLIGFEWEVKGYLAT